VIGAFAWLLVGFFVYNALLPTKRASFSIHSTTENPCSCSHHLSHQQATTITSIRTIHFHPPSKATTHDEMVYSVVACPLGRLSVQELSSFSYLHDLPRLQFGDGDLVIKLGHHVSGWLIIHSKVFAAVSSRSSLFPVVWGMDPEEAADTITHLNTSSWRLGAISLSPTTSPRLLARAGPSLVRLEVPQARQPTLPTALNSAERRSPARSTEHASGPKYAPMPRPEGASKSSDPPLLKL
jgi:hypothetical protein